MTTLHGDHVSLHGDRVSLRGDRVSLHGDRVSLRGYHMQFRVLLQTACHKRAGPGNEAIYEQPAASQVSCNVCGQMGRKR